MADKNNKPPPYADISAVTNPYHAGYDQPEGQGFVAAQQGAFAMQQQTTTGQPGISSRSAVVVTNQPQPPVMITRSRGSDLRLPAIIVCFFCWFTGIPAIIYATKAQKEYGVGNWEAAKSSQKKACGWIIGSLMIPVCIWIVLVILYFTVIRWVEPNADKWNENY